MIPPLFCHPVYICGLCHIHLCTPIILEFCGPAGSQLLPQEMPPLPALSHPLHNKPRCVPDGDCYCVVTSGHSPVCVRQIKIVSLLPRTFVLTFTCGLSDLANLSVLSLPFRLAPASKCPKVCLCHFKAVSRSDCCTRSEPCLIS